MSNTTRNDVKKLASQIENLAKEFQANLENGGDILGTANELVRNSQTFVFTLGEYYALNVSSGKSVPATTVSNPSGTKPNYQNYHNVRDSLGRFTRKV